MSRFIRPLPHIRRPPTHSRLYTTTTSTTTTRSRIIPKTLLLLLTTTTLSISTLYYAHLNPAFRTHFTNSVPNGARILEQFEKVLEEAPEIVSDVRSKAEGLKSSVGEVSKDMKEWNTKIRKSLEEVAGRKDEVVTKVRETVKGVKEGSERNVRKVRESVDKATETVKGWKVEAIKAVESVKEMVGLEEKKSMKSGTESKQKSVVAKEPVAPTTTTPTPEKKDADEVKEVVVVVDATAPSTETKPSEPETIVVKEDTVPETAVLTAALKEVSTVAAAIVDTPEPESETKEEQVKSLQVAPEEKKVETEVVVVVAEPEKENPERVVVADVVPVAPAAEEEKVTEQVEQQPGPEQSQPKQDESEITPAETLAPLDAPLSTQVSTLLTTIQTHLSSLPSTPEVALAQKELSRLGQYLSQLTMEEMDLVEAAIRDQEAIYQERVSTLLHQLADQHLTELIESETKFQQEKTELEQQAQTNLQTKLSEQEQSLSTKFSQDLVATKQEMERHWMREIKNRVDKERSGRLARLDELAFKLKILEKMTVTLSENLQRAGAIFKLQNAVASLKYHLVESESENSLNAKNPFVQELNYVEKTSEVLGGPTHALITTVIQSLPKHAVINGIDTLSSLQTDFHHLVKHVRKTSLIPSSETQPGFLSYAFSSLFSNLLFTKSGRIHPSSPGWQGEDVETIISRAEYYLIIENDLDAAARELNQLNGWAKVLAGDWLNRARQRLEVVQGVETIEAQVRLSTLGAV